MGRAGLSDLTAFLSQAGQVFWAEARRARFRQRSAEFQMHAEVARLLTRYLDPNEAWFTSLENRPRSRLSGLLAKKRGCKSGLPDIAVIVRDPHKIVFIELKGPTGRPSKNQKERRCELKAVGAEWWWTRSIAATMEALRRSNVPFRSQLRQRTLAEWEGPFTGDERRVCWHPKAREKAREVNACRRLRRRMELGIAAPPRPPDETKSRDREAAPRFRGQHAHMQRRRASAAPPRTPFSAEERRRRNTEAVRRHRERERQRQRQREAHERSIAAE